MFPNLQILDLLKKFSVNFNLKGKTKKTTVKAKVLIYQLVKIIASFLNIILLFLMIYELLFGISLKVYCNFFVDFRFLATKSV